MPTDRFTTDSSLAPSSDLAAEHAGQGVHEDEEPILEEVDLFVPDPAWTIEEPLQLLAELHSLLLSGSACLLRPAGHPELVAHPVAIDEAAGRIVWRLSGSLPDRGGLLELGSASVEATIGRIDLLFQCEAFRPMGDDIAQLSSALPPSIRRIQRREAYRLRMRAYSRGGPHVQLRPPRAREPLRIRILDLSIGGCGLLLAPGEEVDWVGTVFRSARVELGPDQILMTGLRVLWQQRVREPDTLSSRIRLGCRWEGLSAMGERTIQQHLDAVQRQRRMMMKDRA